MTRIADTVNRLFDELVHEAWRAPVPAARVFSDRSGAGMEIQLPLADPQGSDVSFATDGQHLTVKLRRRVADRPAGSETTLTREEEIRQTVTLPPGTEAAGIEVRFEPGILRVLVGLRRRSG